MDTTEGVHKPLGRYIFNNVNFSKHDPVLEKLREANYKVIPNPVDPEGVLVTFPVSWDDIEFTNINGTEVNITSAVEQLPETQSLRSAGSSAVPVYALSSAMTSSVCDWLNAPEEVSLTAVGGPTTEGVITAETTWPSTSATW